MVQSVCHNVMFDITLKQSPGIVCKQELNKKSRGRLHYAVFYIFKFGERAAVTVYNKFLADL